MNRRDKVWSLEEDMALDLRRSGYAETMMPYLMEQMEKADPGGKRAHEIAKEYIKTPEKLR